MFKLRYKCMTLVAAATFLSFAGAPLANAQPSSSSPTPSASPAPSSGPTSSATPHESGKHCSIVVKKLKPGQTESEVVSNSCTAAGNTPQAAAVVQSSTLLLSLYRDINYGEPHVDYYGADGPCDVLGYGFRDLRSINASIGGITAYVTYNQCSGQQIYREINYGGTPKFFTGYYVGYVGGNYNDHVHSMKIYRSY